MRLLMKLAVLIASAAVAIDTFGDVTGFTTFTCSDEIAYRYDSVAEACADHGIRAYMDWDESIFPECRICDDDSPPDPPGPGPGVWLPPCPTGQHGHGWDCHADHVCGDDQIGGGSEECEPCGEGEVPNPDGTACQSCPHGEATPGSCARDPCGRDATDDAAVEALKIGQEAKEQLVYLACKNNVIEEYGWQESSPSNPCSITPNNPPHRKSCWRGGSKEDRCNLSLAHTHPWFEWPKAKGVVCNGETIEIPYHADRWNAGGMEFSAADVKFVNLHFLEGHLAVSDRSCVRAVRRHGWKEPVSGTCTPKHRLRKYDTEGDD